MSPAESGTPAPNGGADGVDDLALSRVLASAERLGPDAESRHAFQNRRVLVTGDPTTLATANGRVMLLAGLRLVTRICRAVTVVIPAGLAGLERDSRREAERIARPGTVRFASATDADAFDAVLAIGGRPQARTLCTTINADGWQARVDSSGAGVPTGSGPSNPVAALAAAALGVTDVFKRLCGVRLSRGALFEELSWSLYTYAADSADPGPPLPTSVRLDVLLLGCGAIGNGLIATLLELPVTGRVIVLDRDAFGPENLGTCVLVGPEDVDLSKGEVAAEWLRRAHPGLDVSAIVGTVEKYSADLEHTRVPLPAIVATAFDNAEARRVAQGVWPDLVVDGAIGDFMCQVGVHPWGPDVACLRCLYREPPGEPAEVVAARVTGLTPERAGQADDVVRDSDVAGAPPELKQFLRTRLDRPICSVVSEAVLASIAEGAHRSRFEPSVPFVACLGGAMMAAEIVKASIGWTTPLAPRFQFDALRGPTFGLELPVARRSDCACVTRAVLIERVRAARRALQRVT